MAGFAVPVIEGAGALLLRTLGFGAAAAGGAVIVDAERKRRAEAADNAKAVPISQAGTQTKSKPFDKCPPDSGAPYRRNFPERKAWIDYQARITEMPNGPTFIMEWEFNGVVFDGFISAQCLLQDAKAGYDQFFNAWNGFDYPFQERIFEKMADDAVTQNSAAVPKPPVQLRWYFQQPVSYRYMQKILQVTTPQIEVTYQP